MFHERSHKLSVKTPDIVEKMHFSHAAQAAGAASRQYQGDLYNYRYSHSIAAIRAFLALKTLPAAADSKALPRESKILALGGACSRQGHSENSKAAPRRLPRVSAP